MANRDHIMPQVVLAPIFWGHDYVENPTIVSTMMQLLTDLVTGPFLNGAAQYGIQRGSVLGASVVDDSSPPNTITYKDANNNLQDDITPKISQWIGNNLVPAPSSSNDTNRLYFLFPPPETTVQTYYNQKDPTGNVVQGFHNGGVTKPAPPPTYYWAIVKTGGWLTETGPSPAQTFVQGLAQIVSHELMEQLVDRDGSYEEVGDPCQCRSSTYRGPSSTTWTIQPFWSEWATGSDGSAWDTHCFDSSSPVSLKQFLSAIDFDYQSQGLAALKAPVIDVNYVALTMQGQTTAQTSPDNCFPQVIFNVNWEPNLTGYDVTYSGSGFQNSVPRAQSVELYLSGLTGYTVPISVGVTAVEGSGNISGNFTVTCTNQAPSPNAAVEVQDPLSGAVIASFPINLGCTP
jgi:hypothetical protein